VTDDVARDPLFDRYQAAWNEYVSIRAKRMGDGLGRPISYKRAAADSTDAELQSAAVEVQAAREAFLTDFVDRKSVV
jgi:hypothetical protein